uniref:Chemokine interleukin-8-like domain-containing protein n=1 Tax=Cairina moschata TaxID=8855 RepID=A0A8C3GQ70_CAIMO
MLLLGSWGAGGVPFLLNGAKISSGTASAGAKGSGHAPEVGARSWGFPDGQKQGDPSLGQSHGAGDTPGTLGAGGAGRCLGSSDTPGDSTKPCLLSVRSPHSKCCYKDTLFQKPIPASLIRSYKYTLPNCSHKAVRVELRKGRKVCVDPTEPWFQQYLQGQNLSNASA